MKCFLKVIIIIALFTTTSCGFKISNNIFFTEFYLESINNTHNKNKKQLTDSRNPLSLKLKALSQVVQSSVDNSAGAWHAAQKMLQRVQGWGG